MESLDASYALLSDVSARNRALQARLRGSLPLLWTDNALVMTSAAPRRRRGGLQPEQSAVAGEADQMLLALEEQAGLQVSRRYKRRVEWEVARRIARVDRELQQYPPAQRFWNQKRTKETPAQPRLYRQRLNGVERAQDDANARDSLTVRHGKVAGERRDDVKITAKKYSSDKAANEPKTWVKPSVLTESSSNEKKAVKHVATSPLPVARENAGDQENVAPNAVTAAEFETSDVTNEEPLWGDSGTKQSVDRKLLDDFHLGEVENNRDAGEGVADSEQTTDGVSSRLAEAKTSTPAQAHSTPSEDVVFNPRKDPLASGQHASDDDIASVIDEPVSRRTKPQTEDRPSSSIGRQVLSDFRTMPSVPSFGAQPILPTDGFSKTVNTRLNADVLRRLFSDLDTDKDGHVNRIETCMALHRLQISVSTQKIISFFHYIHSSTDGKAERNRNAQHVPMKEVINYKEFVAFVTAAYDKQQQQKAQRSKSSVRRKAWKEGHDRALPLPVPSTSLPIYSHTARSPQAKCTSAPQLKEQEIRVYELNDAEFEQDEISFEERVIKEIPDFLVSKILAGTANSINQVANESAASIVRKSLESLIGKNSVDDHIVNEITQELLRERLQKLEVSSQDDERDVTGLTQAAAYYNAYEVHDDVESSSGSGDLGSEDLVNWIDILTEEQVSGLVQQIWKDKQASLRHPPIGVVDDTNVENAPTNTPENRSVRRIDEATDTTELEISTFTIVSEKAIQVSDTDCQGEATASSAIPEEECGEYAVSSTATPSRPIYLPQTQFARALGTSPDDFRELFSSVTSIQVLQELRQQRRMHQDLQNGQKTSNACEKTNTQKRGYDINVPLMQNTLLSLEDDSESSDMIDQAPQDEHDLLPLPPTESVLLTEKTLDMNESDVSSHESVLGGSSSMSSSAISSISGNLHGVYRGIDNLQLYERPIKRRRPRERRRPLSVSGSSVPDSLCSAELSEGEISREESSELSDGEIYGDSKRSYINNKNKTPRAIETTDGDDLLHSSVESGELTPMMRIHGGFRRQLLARSVSSSVESGEVEDGTIPS